jgi:Xaa-Pro aminopeptidase
MDYIGAMTGYQFDILRTAVAGSPDPQPKELIRLAIESTEAAINACGPDVPVKEVIRAADSIIDREGLSQHRAKFTGHGIGLDTVEAPFVMAESKEVFQVGHVLCLEPGILIRDIKGARFEHEVVITENGCALLAGQLPGKS